MDLESIQLGSGKVVLEIYLEPTCPHSKRAFEKIRPLLAAVGAGNLTIKIRFVSQPWHLFSGAVTRCVLAAFAEGGMEAGLGAMLAIYRHREEFVCENHSSGPNMRRSPADMIDRISELCGVDLHEAFTLKSVDRALRWHTRYVRQNGAHESPTFAINGLITDKMNSRQSIEEWSASLGMTSD